MVSSWLVIGDLGVNLDLTIDVLRECIAIGLQPELDGVTSLRIGEDVHVPLHLARVIVELLDLDVGEPRIRVLVTDLNARLVDARDVV